MFKLVIEKAEEPEIKLPISVGSSKRQESSRKIYFCFNDNAKAFEWIKKTVKQSSRDGKTRPHGLPPEKYVCRSGSNKLELDMEQQTGSK